MVAALSACADGGGYSPRDDAGSQDASVSTGYVLEFLGPTDLTVGAGVVVPVSARITDLYGTPVSGVNVVFGLAGTTYGSSLRDLEVTSDADGKAETRLSTSRTGEGSFFLRLSAPFALSVERMIVIDRSAVGQLNVDVAYSGTRTLGEIEISVVPGGDCNTAATLSAMGTPSATWPTGTTSSWLTSIPAGGLVAVVAHARSSVGGFAADACVHDVSILRQGSISVSLTLLDRPIFVDDSLTGEVSIDGDTFGDWLGDIGSSAMMADIGTRGGDARLLYHVLEDELRQSGDTSSANAVAALATPSAVSALDADLDSQVVGPTRFATDIEAALVAFAPKLELSGELAFPAVGEPSFTIASAAVLLEGTSYPLENDPLGLVGVEIPLPGAFAIGHSGYHVSKAVLDFSSDDIGRVFLDALSLSLSSSLEAYFAPLLGLDRLFATPSLSSYCTTAACRSAVSHRLYEELIDALEGAFASAAVTHAELQLAGPIELLDTNDDMLVDTATASNGTAAWTAEGAASPVMSTFTLFATSTSPSP